MDGRAMKMAQARRMAGRAMGRPSADMMGRAMVPGMKKGGETKEMMKKEVSFMKKKGAPKSMIKHEEAEYGMKKGVKKMAGGGSTSSFRRQADGIASKGKTKGKIVRMNYGGKC
jgi:hypothetical protein